MQPILQQPDLSWVLDSASCQGVCWEAVSDISYYQILAPDSRQTPSEVAGDAQVMSSCHHAGDLDFILVSDPAFCGVLESEPVDSLSFPLFLFLSFFFSVIFFLPPTAFHFSVSMLFK